jgi:hypothetical protein
MRMDEDGPSLEKRRSARTGGIAALLIGVLLLAVSATLWWSSWESGVEQASGRLLWGLPLMGLACVVFGIYLLVTRRDPHERYRRYPYGPDREGPADDDRRA